MKKFIQGSSILIIGDLITKLISVLYLIPLVRIDDDIIVLMTNLLIPFGFFIVFSTIGINLILTNELVKSKTKDETKKVLIDVGIIIATCTLIGISIMILVAPQLMSTIELNPQYAKALTKGTIALTLGVVLFSITSYIRSILMAYGDYKIISITFITEQLLRVFIILVGSYYSLIIKDIDVVVVVYIIVAAILISISSTLIAYLYHFIKNNYHKRFFEGNYKFENKYIKYLIFSALILFAGGIYITVFDQIDLIFFNTQMLNAGYDLSIINAVKSEYFTLSLKIVMVPISISAAFIQVMIKQIGESKEKSKEMNQIIYLVSLYSIFMMTIIMLTGSNVYQFFYGEKSTGIIIAQTFIIPIYIFKNIIGGYIMTNGGKYSSIVISTITIISLKIILDLILFNYLHVFGYIMASVLSLVVGTIILISMNKKMFINIKTTFKTNLILYIKAFIMIILAILLFKVSPTINTNFLTIVYKSVIILMLFIVFFFQNIKDVLKS